ncbi:MAG: DMT family transporter [Pseudomonadota bacterium]
MSIVRLGLLVFLAVSLVVLGDTAGKLLTQAGVAPVLIAWARFALAALFLLPLSGLRMGELRLLLDWRIALRGAFIACGIACILTGLRTEPLADVFGAFFIGPIVSYVLAVAILGERPSALRAVQLAIGFVGVLLVVKPGFGGGAGMLFALAAGVCYGAYLAMTRAVAGGFRPRFLLLSQLLVGSVLLAPLGLSAPVPPVDAGILALFALSAGGSAAGNYLLVQANRHAEASLIAPLVYTQLITATVMSGLVFAEWPDALSLAGLALILGSGLGTLWTAGRAARA